LHDQAAGTGYRPRPRHRAGHRGRSRRTHRGELATGRRRHLPRDPHRRPCSRSGGRTMTPIRVLVADDEKNLRELLVRELTRKGHAAVGVPDGYAALEALKEDVADVLLLDMKMPRVEGIEVLRALQEYPEMPQVIVMTGFQEVSSAVEAMKLGAYDYLTKPARIEELDILIRKAAEKGRLKRKFVVLRAQLDPDPSHAGILTTNAKMEDVLRVVDRVAPTDSSVLILGESGTGKELVARAVHE